MREGGIDDCCARYYWTLCVSGVSTVVRLREKCDIKSVSLKLLRDSSSACASESSYVGKSRSVSSGGSPDAFCAAVK